MTQLKLANKREKGKPSSTSEYSRIQREIKVAGKSFYWFAGRRRSWWKSFWSPRLFSSFSVLNHLGGTKTCKAKKGSHPGCGNQIWVLELWVALQMFGLKPGMDSTFGGQTLPVAEKWQKGCILTIPFLPSSGSWEIPVVTVQLYCCMIWGLLQTARM